MTGDTDEQLVQACLRGNEEAWVALIRRYSHLIYGVIRSYRLPESDGADIFQSVCLELFNSLPRLREVQALRRWLITVTSHQCQKWKRLQQTPAEEGSPLDVEFVQDPEASRRLVMVEREQILREAMSQLPVRCREMIALLFLKDPPMAYAELASHMNLAVGSIGFIRKRCLNKLKAALDKLGL